MDDHSESQYNFFMQGSKLRMVGTDMHYLNSESTYTRISNLALPIGASIIIKGEINDISDLERMYTDNSILTVSSDTIKAISTGKANLILKRTNSLTFTIPVTVEEAPSLGNICMNGETSVLDVILLQKYLLTTIRLTKNQADLADLNQDGVIDVFDLALLKRTLLNAV